VYAIATLAAIVFIFAIYGIAPYWDPGWQPILLVLFVVALQSTNIVSRIRATLVGVAPASVAVLACVTYASPSQAIIYAGVGTLIAKWLIVRLPRIKAIFNASKETLAAAAAGAAAYGVGFVPLSEPSSGRSTGMDVLALCAAAGAYALVDELLTVPVLSLASGLPVRQIVLPNIDVRLGIKLGGLAATIAMYFGLLQSDLLLLGLPVLVYGLHLTSAMHPHPLRARDLAAAGAGNRRVQLRRLRRRPAHRGHPRGGAVLRGRGRGRGVRPAAGRAGRRPRGPLRRAAR